MLKMKQDIGNKLEAKMHNLQEALSKEIQDIKLKQEEMQNTITEIKNSLEATNSRIQEAEERISEVEDRLQEIMDAEQKREKRLKTNEESLRDLWDNVKRTNIHIIGVPEGEGGGTEKIFQEIIAKHFPHMGKEPLTQIQEAKQVPYEINPMRNTPRYILIKLTKIKDKEKILKAAREKKHVTHKGTPISILEYFSAETLQARREWHDILKVMKGKKPPTKITLPSKALIRI
uniref:L1 transposable element RRM domain-containing protein n=1 Tax=Sus scrofa TaxID=9823 RepID=A0A8D1LJL8_PIG